jgi:uncharacterized membrane protein
VRRHRPRAGDNGLAGTPAASLSDREVRTSHVFDTSVIAKDEDGKVRIVVKPEEPTGHGAAVGLGWGLAVGVATTPR